MQLSIRFLVQISGFNILENVEFAQCKCFISKMPVIALKVSHEAFLNQPRLYIFLIFPCP